MRCLYCRIKLKIAAKAKVIQYCPECSMRIEYEGRHETRLRPEDRNRSAQPGSNRPPAAFASMKSA